MVLVLVPPAAVAVAVAAAQKGSRRTKSAATSIFSKSYLAEKEADARVMLTSRCSKGFHTSKTIAKRDPGLIIH
jgi:hypothetical protein